MISVNDINSAYRLILGRDPEVGLDLVTAAERYGSLAELRREMIGSSEAGSVLFDSIIPHLGGVWVRRPTYFGRQIYLCLSDAAVSKTILLTGDWEPEVGRGILDLLKPGDTFLDVGANIGWFSLLAGDYLSRNGGGHVVAIEANPGLVPHLGASIADSGLASTVALKPYAVAEKLGLVEMSTTETGNVGGLSIAPLSDKRVGSRNVVPCMPLDDLLGDLPRVDLIKMDIEGAEPSAIKGAINLLESHQPLIIMEVNADGLQNVSKSSVSNLLMLMDSLGYRPYQFRGAPKPLLLSSAQVGDLVNQYSYYDVLFQPV